MDKQEVIKAHEADHREMGETIQRLSKEEMAREKVLGDWTVKDILAHLNAWAWECVKEIDRVLQNGATWHRVYPDEKGESKLNKREIRKRRDKGLKEILQEWEESFQALINRIEKLSDKEWCHQSSNDMWGDGKPMTVMSLFDYEYKGEGHEAAHATQIKRHFNLS